jgi:hypothetical protein
MKYCQVFIKKVVRDLKVEGQKSFDMFPSHKILFFGKK